MRYSMKYLLVGSLFLFGGTACADLDVSNPNSADAERALASPGDVESLIAGSLNSWFSGIASYSGPGMFLSNAAFQHNAPWANSGMEHYARIPRIAIQNDVADTNYGNFTRVWYRSYRAIAAVADGLKAIENNPAVAQELTPEQITRAKAFGKFVQGISHATVALFYDRGFVVTEETDLTQPQDPLGYNELMTAALGFFDEAIQLSSSANFDIPTSWFPASPALSGPNLARVAHSYKARFRAQAARTPAERQSVNWGAVIADVDAGITGDFKMDYNWNNGWEIETMGYLTYHGWSQLAYYVWGMADQDGDYQRWLNLPLTEKSYEFAGGEPVLIITPDLRFPQGETVAEQRDNPGTLARQSTAAQAGGTWQRPDRGTWRWSWYKARRYEEYWREAVYEQPEITLAEMRLLKAEGIYRNGGDMGQVASIINESRTAAGLNATDAAGTNTSCVPKLPNGSCGDLLEMLKWEKRMTAAFTGIASVNWYWDARGWGDLFQDTYLHFPVPCQELQVLNLLPCNNVGGPGGEMGSTGSVYNYPDEN
jgi:hypothetical protein